MKTNDLLQSLALAGALSIASAAEDKTFSEKASDTFNKAVEKTKDAGRAVADTSRKAADSVDRRHHTRCRCAEGGCDAERAQDQHAQSLSAGKTAFVVTNKG
jgi:hypothetical protein